MPRVFRKLFQLLSLFAISLVFAACLVSTQRQGGIRVESNVPDAVLIVDEEVRGPVQAYRERYLNVDPGTHRVQLEHPDHFTEFVEVEVPSKMGVAVRVDMRRRPE